MGKWDSIKNRFPASSLDGTPDYKSKVDALKNTYVGNSFQVLLARFDELHMMKDEHQDAIKDLNAELEALGQLLIAKFEEQNLRSVKTDDGKSFTVSVTPYPSVFDPTALEAHIAANPGLDYLYKVHPAALGALVRDLLETGRDAELPAGVKIFMKSGISVRKA